MAAVTESINFHDTRPLRIGRVAPEQAGAGDSLGASLLTQLQEKNQPRNARREIFVLTCGQDIARTLSLPRIGLAHALRNGRAKWRQNRAAKGAKITHVINTYTLAEEAVGFELVSRIKFPANREINRAFF
jgi:hypothetical protein